jgi:hypothetical protein
LAKEVGAKERRMREKGYERSKVSVEIGREQVGLRSRDTQDEFDSVECERDDGPILTLE